MGFKRTSEGRVFFQGADDGDGAGQDQQKDQFEQGFPKSLGAPQTQVQIITLLKTLNERLKITQAERQKMQRELEAYKHLIEDLEEKADRSERAYMDMERRLQDTSPKGASPEVSAQIVKELTETRKMLLELEDKAERADRGVSVLSKLQREQAEKLATNTTSYASLVKRLKNTESRQEDLSIKVEDTASQQSRMLRKIDKAVEDRARFMRKIERIEETVLQTRDSLNAKAMVLLTDQAVADESGVQGSPAHDALAPDAHTYDDAYAKPSKASWLQNINANHAAAAGAFAFLLVAGTWVYMNAASPQPSYTAPVQTANVQPWQQGGQSQPSANANWSIQQDTAEFDQPSTISAADQAAEPMPEYTINVADSASDDIGTLNLNDPDQVEALLNTNPDGVAAALNDIEPGSASPQSNSVIMARAEPLTPMPEPAATKPEEPAAPIKPVEAASNIPSKAPPANLGNPADRMKPDSSLPASVKEIEAQAFDSVPEAQHDLAAIYTAGHGGVKQNFDRAAFWFEEAANRGVANAAYNLGVLYHQGMGVKEDIDDAIGWYTRAASLGHPEAQYNLGIAYIEGIGVPYNPVKAADYFENAAGSGIMEAAYNLGLIYENGLLSKAEPDKALMWYKTASDQGSPEAKEALEQLAKSLNISLSEVNKLAESVRTEKKTEKTAVAKAPQTQSSAPAPFVPAEQPPTDLTQNIYGDEIAPYTPYVPNTLSTRSNNEQVVIAQVQEYLMRMGLYPGPADGVTGPLTQDAIRSYQRLHSLSPDGKASEGLLSHMLANVISNDLKNGAIEQGSSYN